MTVRADHRCCLSSPAHRFRCKLYDSREGAMSKASCAGRSLLELMEDELDRIVWDLMVEEATGATGLGQQLKGEARGVTACIALVRTPYAPDLDAVRAAAMDRYRARLAALRPTG